ncbi:MAG: response regulator [Lachnospiraceae bacterium]|nr:response regulator [Lachnospiraceae bacterium]
MGYFILALQVIGISVPIVGVIVLLHREQHKLSVHLMLTDIGCLVMNCGYYLLLRSNTYDEAMLALRIQYLGNLLFYYFFGMFLVFYFNRIVPRFLFYIWAFYEGLTLIALWNEPFMRLVFRSIEYTYKPNWNLHVLEVELGLAFIVRYSIIAFILLGALGFTTIRMFLTKNESERNNFARLAGAEFIVMLSLSITIIVNPQYDIMPLMGSLAICSIILSVLHGEFFGIAEMGKTWVFDQMSDAVIIVDKSFGYVDSNACAKAIFPELKNMIPGIKVPGCIYELFATDRENCDMNGKFYTRKLNYLAQDGKSEGYSLLLTDVTHQHELMEQLKEEKERADEANQAKSAFMSNMSHEIRTPMNAIVGMTDILLRRQFSPQETEYLQNIKNSGNALLTIINDILDLSKIESGKLEIVEESYEPMSLFSDLSMIFLNRIGDKDIELIFDIDKKLPLKLKGDALRLRQVIINLVNNAIKFTDKGHVKLAVEITGIVDDKIELLFRVVDTGQGIKREDLSKLFGSFQQVDTKKNRHKEGTGLGLAISKQLVEMMGGTIGVASEYGKGSEFYFTLPQMVMDAQCAATKKEHGRVAVSGWMRSQKNMEILQKLTKDYALVFVDREAAWERGSYPNFFFVDDMELLGQVSKQVPKDANTTLCLLQNPMRDSAWSDVWEQPTIMMNKPLYSLNFCQIINGERSGSFVEEEKLQNFVAPEAEILIVDDNEMNLKVAMGLLEPLKLKIDTAGDGKEALEMIQRKHYHLVFMDHMMPVLDGIEATKLLRQMEDPYCQQVPVIALTANAVVEAKATFLAAGMNDFVAKPIKMKDICEKLRKHLPPQFIQETSRNSQSKATNLPAIEGLDVEEGIRNTGSLELFLSLLGDFYRLIDMKADKMEKCLEQGQIKEYVIEVHALKNTARLIGAMELSGQCYTLERYGNEGKVDRVLEETPSMLALYRSYKELLQKYAADDAGEKEAASNKDLLQILDGLKDAVDTFDLDKADAAMRSLEKCQIPQVWEEKMTRLSAYVADVDMEQVLVLVEEMKKDL